MIRKIGLLVCGLILILGVTACEVKEPENLDGKQFVGPTGEKGKKVDHEDVLSFSDGKFTSSACFQYGFKSGPYTATVEGDSIHFQAETVSPTHGKMEWKGTLKDGILDVAYSWTKERWLWTTHREYWFTGSLKE
jgi:hypothetical protein